MRRRRLLDTRRFAMSKTALGSGLHQRIGECSSNQGKIPVAYADNSRSGSRSPPTATKPSPASAKLGSGQHGSVPASINHGRNRAGEPESRMQVFQYHSV